MAIIVEDGTGLYEANSYASLGYVRNYLTRRNRTTAWTAATLAEREAAVIAATDYIDRRFGPRFIGVKEFREIDVQAYSILSFEANATNNDTVTIGSTVYTFAPAASSAFEVTIGADAGESCVNLAAAINLTAGGAYGAGTTVHPDVTAEVLPSGTDLIVRANVAGETGEDIATTASNENAMVWGTTSTRNGYEGTEQFLEWPRLSVYSRSGVLVEGIPEKLKQAVAEYADRALSATLMPDPTIDESGKTIIAKREKLGPIEEETTYAEGSQLAFKLRPYPAADRLLSEYVTASGGVFR